VKKRKGRKDLCHCECLKSPLKRGDLGMCFYRSNRIFAFRQYEIAISFSARNKFRYSNHCRGMGTGFDNMTLLSLFSL
jgi:hypothetical protein